MSLEENISMGIRQLAKRGANRRIFWRGGVVVILPPVLTSDKEPQAVTEFLCSKRQWSLCGILCDKTVEPDFRAYCACQEINNLPVINNVPRFKSHPGHQLPFALALKPKDCGSP
jgi:hypothetical protein